MVSCDMVRVNIFRHYDGRLVKEGKTFSSYAAAKRFCKYIAPKIYGGECWYEPY